MVAVVVALPMGARASDIIINELLASNTSSGPDIVDFEYYSDWIELKNRSFTKTDLASYYLSDDPANPTKWSLEGISLGPRSLTLIYADGHDSRPGDSVPSQYWPFHTVDVENIHAGFRLSTDGETLLLSRKVEGIVEIVDTVSYPPQLTDISYGRDSDGAWHYLSIPTPKARNAVAIAAPVRAGRVIASLPPGLHSSPQLMTFETGSPAAEIRYTVNGPPPVQTSRAFRDPIPLTKSVVLRARAFEAGIAAGPMLTRTVLLDLPDHKLPIVALAVAPAELYGPKGIYSPTTRKGREVPITMEYFPDPKTHAFSIDAGVRIGGENIWLQPQKPLNLALRDRYGSEEINFRLFKDSPITSFDRIGLRNGGDNWSVDMLPDAIAASIVRGHMKNPVAAARPVVVYLNGDYHGIHFLRQRWGDSCFAEKFQAAPGSYDHVKFGRTQEGIAYVASEGTAQDLVDLLEEARTAVMEDDEVFDRFAQRVDIDAFIDYVAMVDFTAETSWNHNQEIWRHRDGDGKWVWMINDIDRSFNESNSSSDLLGIMRTRSPLLSAFLKNRRFRDRLAQRYAAHIASTFHPERLNEIVDSFRDELVDEIPRHVSRWLSTGGIPSLDHWSSQIGRRKRFNSRRGSYALQNARRVTSPLRPVQRLILRNSVPEGGRIHLCDVPLLPREVNEVKLMADVPFDLKAVPAPGYRFAGWSTGEEEATITTAIPPRETAISANFEPIGASVIQSPITGSRTIGPEDQPYVVTHDLIVQPGGHLTILAGTVLEMAQDVSICVKGTMSIRGTEDDPVIIRPHESASSWGGLGFVHAEHLNTLTHLKLIKAIKSHSDPLNLKGALSALHSNLLVIGAEISAPSPIFVRGGGISLFSSTIRPEFTGDGINVKGGRTLIENCTFYGNEAPDTDAIDTDHVVNGVIRNCRIYHFRGSNSDAIDAGEECLNLTVTGNRVYHCSDKGVSVGQGSSARIFHNLFVGCGQGVGIKDEGSIAFITNNTFVNNASGVAVFEKNIGSGGGAAQIENCLFVNSPLSVDDLSQANVRYSLSNGSDLPEGDGNLRADPSFVDPSVYDFSLHASSLAIGRGTPVNAAEPDGERSDIGATLEFLPDYPGAVPGSVIVNEILTHSSAENGDWIELHNRSSRPVDLSGWYLSDSEREPSKYRIPEGTMLPPDGYLVFTEADHFGSDAESGFALSENGEKVVITGPGVGLAPDYREVETFGPSAEDVSRGSYAKTSTGTRNFVAMVESTPGRPNSPPQVGPIVISEIMFAPTLEDAEFIELMNITDRAIDFYRTQVKAPWRVTEGIDHEFSAEPRLRIEPGERIVLARDSSSLEEAFSLPPDVRVLSWTSGRLHNAGEKVEISFPGDLEKGIRQYVRVDRVNYSVTAPWPTPDPSGLRSLTRIDVTAYGNDPANWRYESATPGTSAYELWRDARQIDAGGADEDPDRDGRSNYFEFATGTDPLSADGVLPLAFSRSREGAWLLRFPLWDSRSEMFYRFEVSPDLTPGSWSPIPTRLSADGAREVLKAELSADHFGSHSELFFRLAID